MTLQERIQQLKQAQGDLSGILASAQRTAAQAAVESATEATPPNESGGPRGVNMITGELKEHWESDSQVDPVVTPNELTSILANNMEYASYVDQGHRLDKHFVPGLYIDPYSGLLSKDLTKGVGLVVGTKTKFVKGEFMTDKGKEAYEETLLKELDGAIERVMK